MANQIEKFVLIVLLILASIIKVAAAQSTSVSVWVNETNLEPRIMTPFAWLPGQDNDSDPLTYDFELTNETSFSSLLVNKTKLNSTHYFLTEQEALPNGIFFYHLRTCDFEACSPWTVPASISIEILVPDDIKLKILKSTPYLSGKIIDADDEPFRSHLTIQVKVSDARLLNLSLNATLEDLKFRFDQDPDGESVPFKREKGGYLIDTTVHWNGNKVFFPFDSYNTEIYVSPPRLKRETVLEDYDNGYEFRLEINSEPDKISIRKIRTWTFLFFYLIALLFLCFVAYWFGKHALHQSTNLGQPSKVLNLLLGVAGIIGFVYIGGLHFFISLGTLVLGIPLLISICFFFYNVNRDRGN